MNSRAFSVLIILIISSFIAHWYISTKNLKICTAIIHFRQYDRHSADVIQTKVREVSYLFLIPVSLFKFFLMKVVDHQN